MFIRKQECVGQWVDVSRAFVDSMLRAVVRPNRNVPICRGDMPQQREPAARPVKTSSCKKIHMHTSGCVGIDSGLHVLKAAREGIDAAVAESRK